MQWQIAPILPAELAAKFPEIPPVVLQLLYNRKITTREEIDEFLNPDYNHHLHDPFLFKQMPVAVERIFLAITSGEKIVVHGDYDADGVTSSAVMFTTLRKLIEIFGHDDKNELLDIFIPHREKEGYGLKNSTVELFIKNNVNLVVTVDCGTASVEEIKLCQKNNIDVVVTDHHQETLELPPAVAIINPHLKTENYPFKELSGVGVAFKTAQALLSEAKKRAPQENWEGFEKWLLDLVAIGTVADVMPLIGENRTLVNYGLVVLNKTQRIGLKKLFEGLSAFNINGPTMADGINTQVISFQIAPRLNSAGRIDHASTAYELLITEDVEEALKLIGQIEQTNNERQALTEQVVTAVTEDLAKQKKQGCKILIGLGRGWPPGLVGLVAGKLVRQFNLPVIVASDFEGKIIASGRSLPQFDLMDPLRQLDSEKFFANYGGHAQACGFTLASDVKFEDFVQRFQTIAQEVLDGVDLSAILNIDIATELKDINWTLYDAQERFAPFGYGNLQPLYCLRNLTVDSAQGLGKDQSHLKIMVSQNKSKSRKLIGFGLAKNNPLQPGDVIDVVVELGVNQWNGNRELQMKIVDLKKVTA